MVLKRQQETGHRAARVQIVAQVRDAARSVQNTLQRCRPRRPLARPPSASSKPKSAGLEVGLSTNLELQVRQRDLAQARVTELDAMIAYNRAIIQLDRVQKIQ